jgi:hypothetical protein
MSEQVGHAVWQTTHLGGHRFAATAVVLPHAICYGRVGAGDVEAIVTAHRSGRVHLPRMRGRSGYDGLVQAADFFLRAKTGDLDLAHFRLQRVGATGERGRVVELAAPDGAIHALRIEERDAGVMRLESCAATEPTEVGRFRLVQHLVQTPD